MHGPSGIFWANLTPFSLQATTGACKHALALAGGDMDRACALILDDVIPADSGGDGTDLLKEYEGTYVAGPCRYIDGDQPYWFHRLDRENQGIIRFKGSAPPSAFNSGKSREAAEWVMTAWQGPHEERVILTGTKSEKIDDAKFDRLVMTPSSKLSWAPWATAKGALEPDSVKIMYFGGEWCPYCPPFTAKLKSFFEVARKCFGDMAVQVIFVSGDRSSDDMLNYFGSRHGDWFALPYEQQRLNETLNERFHVDGIPSIRVLDYFGDVVEHFRDGGTCDFAEAIRHMPSSNPENYVRALYKKLKDNIPSNDKGFLSSEERDSIKDAMKKEGCGHGNLVGCVNDLRSGDFQHAARGLRHYLQVAEDWDETTACNEAGMEVEVARLKDCPDCVSCQALVLDEMNRSAHAEATKQLAAALTKLKEAEAIAHQARLEHLAQTKVPRSSSFGSVEDQMPRSDASNDDAVYVASCAAEQAVQDMRKQVEAIRDKMAGQGFWFYGYHSELYGCEQTTREPVATTETFEVGPICNNDEAGDKVVRAIIIVPYIYG
jgi:thiol-disulfide isomerase/thioredoxin